MNISSINWFEIPVNDMERAIRFYEEVFVTELQRNSCVDGLPMAIFQADRARDGVTGCLVQGPHYQPAVDGSMVYLNASPSIDAVLARVRDAGGDILLQKTALPPGIGFFAHIVDTEGNRVGVHALA